MQRTINVPQLAIVEFNYATMDCWPDVLEQMKTLINDEKFFFNFDEHSKTAIFYKLFSKNGSRRRLTLNGTEYVHNDCVKPQRIRLVVVIPSDYVYSINDNDFKLVIKRIKLAALMAQSIIAIALRKRYGANANETSGCLTFTFDTHWSSKTAEVPMENRTFAGSDCLLLSDPLFCDNDDKEYLPPLAILRTNKTSAELYGTKNKAAYFLECLQILEERNPQYLLHLIFILPSSLNGDDRIATSQQHPKPIIEAFETKRDVCVILSTALLLMPKCVQEISAVLNSTEQLQISTCRSLPRIISYEASGKFLLRHTVGGAVASLLGAIVHEIGHLLKLPHTESGIMKTGGDNVQTLFLIDKHINLALHEADGSSHCTTNIEYFSGIQQTRSDVALLSKRINESQFDEISLDLLRLSAFISSINNAFNGTQPIVYNRENQMVQSGAGIIRVACFSASKQSTLISYRKYNRIKQLSLHGIDKGQRILVVNADGNSAIFAI